MSLDTAYDAVKTRAETLWPTVEPDVAVTFENARSFTVPTDADGKRLPWLLVEVDWIDGDQESIGAPGGNLVRYLGNIFVHAFIPRGTGASRAHQLAARAMAIFASKDFGGLVTQAGKPIGPNSSEDGQYFGQSAWVPFQFDETA